MSDHVYSGGFYDYIDAGSRASARIIARLLLAEVEVRSLLDVGAGHGAWAAEWMTQGVSDVLAVDGDYVARDRLSIAADRFRPHDLLQPLDLGRRFDLVQSLEVAEHLPESSADQFVKTLTRHGDVILFSAAVPHQGGEHHVNEQPLSYWRAKFAASGYSPYDWIRPRIRAERAIMPWYRFNTLIYANEVGAARLSAPIRESRVQESVPIDIAGDMGWRARRAIVRLIPPALVKPIAIAKAHVARRLRG